MIDIPVEKLAIKLVDTLCAGIGAALRPWMIRRVGRAEADVERIKQLSQAQTGKEVESIEKGEARLVNGQVVSLQEEPKAVTLRDLELLAEDFDRGRRVEQTLALLKIAHFAYEEAQEQPGDAVSDEPIDPDWFARWRNGAQDVRSEDLQRLWARILVGEVKQPGSFSLRTLALLAQLTKKEAEVISRVAPFVIDYWIYDSFSSPVVEKPKETDIIVLKELGIVNNTVMSVTFTTAVKDRFSIAFKYFDKEMTIERDDNNQRIELWIYMITSVGGEILSLGRFTPNYKYLEEIAIDIRKREFTVNIKSVIHSPDD